MDRITETETSFSYDFNETEIMLLARLFRKNQAELPKGLEKFASKIEHIIYTSLSIEEVEKFYS